MGYLPDVEVLAHRCVAKAEPSPKIILGDRVS
jgi:hypothetical protein